MAMNSTEPKKPTFDLGIKNLYTSLDADDNYEEKINENRKSTVCQEGTPKKTLADITNNGFNNEKTEFEVVLTQLLDSLNSPLEESLLKPVNRKRNAIITSDEDDDKDGRQELNKIATNRKKQKKSRQANRIAKVYMDSGSESDLEMIAENWVSAARVPVVDDSEISTVKHTSLDSSDEIFKLAISSRTRSNAKQNNELLDNTEIDLVTSDEEDLFSNDPDDEDFEQCVKSDLIEREAQCLDDSVQDCDDDMDGSLEESFVDDRTMLTQQLSQGDMRGVYLRSLQSQWR